MIQDAECDPLGLHLLKVRQGSVGVVPLLYRRSYTRVEDADIMVPRYQPPRAPRPAPPPPPGPVQPSLLVDPNPAPTPGRVHLAAWATTGPDYSGLDELGF